MSAQEILFTLGIILNVFPGVMSQSNKKDVAGMVAAGAVAFFLLAVVITMIVLGVTWNDWYPKFQRLRGKVKVPKHIWKMRQKENNSIRGSFIAASEKGYTKASIRDRDAESWVQQLSIQNPDFPPAYEEKDITIELGEEKDDEFRIETTIVDNETLDLGPFHSNPDSSRQPSGGIANQPDMEMTELYATVDKSKEGDSPLTSSGIGTAISNGNGGTEEQVTHFSMMDPTLVAF